MKKLILSLALVLVGSVLGASAQTVQESKTFDNMYLGVNGGFAAKSDQSGWLKHLDPTFGVRLGRWITPVVGWAVEGQMYMDNADNVFFRGDLADSFTGLNLSGLGTINFSNWFSGYPGEPRTFEVIAVAGLGWGHAFNEGQLVRYNGAKERSLLTSKLGVDFTFNLGEAKAWQVYVEPSMVWGLNVAGQKIKYNYKNAVAAVNVGVNYKFGNSNGTHNFVVVDVEGLNAKINAQRAEIDNLNAENAAKQAQIDADAARIAELQRLLDECRASNKPVVSSACKMAVIPFAQNSSALTNESKAALDVLKGGANAVVKGYASPEGRKAYNQKLSEKRATAVKDYLESVGVSVASSDGLGVAGNTSNRIVIVTID